MICKPNLNLRELKLKLVNHDKNEETPKKFTYTNIETVNKATQFLYDPNNRARIMFENLKLRNMKKQQQL